MQKEEQRSDQETFGVCRYRGKCGGGMPENMTFWILCLMLTPKLRENSEKPFMSLASFVCSE